jgi:hypothetical protein
VEVEVGRVRRALAVLLGALVLTSVVDAGRLGDAALDVPAPRPPHELSLAAPVVPPSVTTMPPATSAPPATSISSSTVPSPVRAARARPAPTRPATIAGSATGVGVYAGAGRPSGVSSFGSVTRTDPKVAMDFVDMTRGWSDLASPTWLLDAWTPWLQADASRRLVLSVPMLIKSATGDYDNTSYDAYHRQLAQNIADRGIASQVIIRLGWEMNGGWFPWGKDADGYKRMWRRLVPVYRSVSSALTFDWCVNGGSPNPEAWYPGDDVVDIVGMDQYDIVWQHPGGDQAWRWSQIAPNLQWHADFSTKHGKRAAVDEWSLWSADDTSQGGGGDNPTYVRNMVSWASSHAYAHATYFNVAADGPHTTIEENPNGLAAFSDQAG